jgi:hypothetical protein
VFIGWATLLLRLEPQTATATSKVDAVHARNILSIHALPFACNIITGIERRRSSMKITSAEVG